jgi:hypothetical protein
MQHFCCVPATLRRQPKTGRNPGPERLDPRRIAEILGSKAFLIAARLELMRGAVKSIDQIHECMRQFGCHVESAK